MKKEISYPKGFNGRGSPTVRKDCWKCKGEGMLLQKIERDEGFAIKTYDLCPICEGVGELDMAIPMEPDEK